MKTEDLQAKGLSQEQIDFVMAENGKDVNPIKAELTSAQTTITQLTNDKTTLQNSLSDVQGKLSGFKDVDVDKLQVQIQTLTNDLQTEKENAKKAESKHALEKSVGDFLQDKQFVNDFTKNSITNSLMEELDKESAKGKSISDIFNSLVNGEDGKPQPNILVDTNAQNNAAHFTGKPMNVPPVGTKLSPTQLMQLKNENPNMDVSQYM